LVLAAIDPGHGRGSAFWIRLLRGRWMTWLGTISYGIYLWNTVVLELISRHPGPRTLSSAVVLWMAVLDGTLVLAAASWYLVERPSQRLLRAYERRAQRGGGPGRSPETAVGVQTVADGLNPSGVAVDHLA
jgi:peptidoglycan/LPS O-acetylase OafA/YrhL